MPKVYCDDCGCIGESISVMFPPEKLMNEHDKEVHKGKGFEYQIWKD